MGGTRDEKAPDFEPVLATLHGETGHLCRDLDYQGGAEIPSPVFTSGINRYFPAWQIRLEWQILANIGKSYFFATKYWKI